ncbi:MAG: peptidoglycan-binding protein [Acutalibacteraceae bacterium]|nr:peptidoglycan-binding protein [Acutalibacteraceae bacterium]
MHKQSKGKIILSLLLSIIMIFSVVTVGTVSMSAETSTGIGLCAYALNAYNEGWPYVWGGCSYGAVDCSGLIHSYNGVGGVRTDMLSSSQSAGLDWGYVSNGVPNVHGLGLHKPGHVGVYVGSNQVIDARGTNWGIIYASLNSVNWVEWYKIVGVSYPENGWVKFDGESFYYEDGEYIENTTRTLDNVKYTFDSLGRSDKEPPKDAYEVTDYSKGSSSSSGSTTKYLKVGSQGEKVKEVQQMLKDLGYFDDEVTGYYGTYTAACVKEFQADAKIEVDGIVGPEFMSTIKSDKAPSKNGAGTSNNNSSNDKKEETEAPTEQVTEAVTEAPTEVVTEEVTEAPTEEVTEATTEATTEEATETVTEEATEEATEKATEAPTEAPTLPPTPLEDGVIYYGENDVDGCTDIADMQTRLIELGYYTTGITGVFDDNTLVALEKYFAASELKAESFITREQYDVLMSESAIANPDNSDYTQEEINNVQSMLVKLGYLSNATGVYDDTTISAVKTAQANFDMEVTGEITDEFVKALELAVARKDSQVTTGTTTTTTGNTTSNSTNATSATTATSAVTTATTSAKTAPVTGYFEEVSAPDSSDDTAFLLVSGMMLTLALGTAVVYLKNRVVSKKNK